MKDFNTTLTLSSRGLVLKIFGDTLVIETTDPDELRRQANIALGDELMSVSEAAAHVKVSDRTIRNWITGGKLEVERRGGGIRIRKRDLDR